MLIKEIKCKSALHRLYNKKLPYSWDLNIYRGCNNGCKYCYALYSHDYLNDQEFYNTLYIKTNIVEELERDLKKRSWKNQIINIGGVTDSYQSAEEEYRFMPEILKLLIKYRNPAIISTKSDLILRDFDLIEKLSKLTYINIASTITTTDPKVSKLIEPNASSPDQRFNILREFKKTNASVGLHVMPIIPLITDSKENIDSLFKRGKDINISYLLTGALYLRGKTKTTFLNFVKEALPEKYNKMKELYINGSLNREYKNNLYNKVRYYIEKYKLPTDFNTPLKQRIKRSEDRYYDNLLF